MTVWLPQTEWRLRLEARRSMRRMSVAADLMAAAMLLLASAADRAAAAQWDFNEARRAGWKAIR